MNVTRSLTALAALPAFLSLSLIHPLPARAACSTSTDTYVPVAMGSIPGSRMSEVRSVNARGVAVGWSFDTNWQSHAFLWQNGQPTDLGTLGGATSDAYSVNSSGAITGNAATADGSPHAFLWQNGAMQDLGTLGGPSSYGYGINDAGQVVGWSEASDGASHAFLWADGTMAPLTGVPGNFSMANAVNNLGVVAGSYEVAGSYMDEMWYNHAFVWAGGQFTDLGTFADLGGTGAQALGLNDAGDVVGSFTDADWQTHGFLLHAGQVTDFGPGTMAYSINNLGQVAGSRTDADGYEVPFLWADGKMTDLAAFAGTTNAISDTGLIAGATSGNQALILQPGATSDTIAPTTSLLLTGLTGDNGWYRSDVQAVITGVDDCPDNVVSIWYTLDGGTAQAYTGPVTVTGDATHTLTYWGVDVAGNAETKHVQTVAIDATAPTVAWGSVPAGWTNTAVYVPFTASDATSGVVSVSTPSPLAFTTEGAHQTASVTVRDAAGNTATLTSPEVNIDLTAPKVTWGTVPAGWANTAVYIPFTTSDNLSGVVSVSSPSPLAFTQEGAHQTTTIVVRDAAGNTTTLTSPEVNIDLTAPKLAWGSAPAGWVNGPVYVPFATSDNLSGVVFVSTTSPLAFTAEGAHQTATVTVRDAAGNTATLTSPEVNIDLTAPQISATSSATTLWSPNGTLVPVTVTGKATDLLAGVGASADFHVVDEYGTIQPDGPVQIAADGSFSFTITLQASRLGSDKDGRGYQIQLQVQDGAGNVGATTVSVIVPHDL